MNQTRENGSKRSQRPLLARRMREAADAAGLSSGQIARALGCSASGVRAWWSGKHEPRPRVLAAYADLVGRSVAELRAETEQAAEVLRRLANGESPEAALGRAPREELSRSLSARRVRLYQLLMEVTGGNWQYFGEAGRVQFLLDLIRELEPPEDEPEPSP